MMRRSTVSPNIFSLLVLLAAFTPVFSQAPARFLGTIMAMNGNRLTVRTDSGQAREVAIVSSTAIKRIAPGQRDLSTAEDILLTDLAVGDRALIKLDPDGTANPPEALQVVAIKQSDVVKLHLKEREDWQLHGVGGLVKSVDPASGTIVVASGTGPTLKTITIHTSQATVLRRYQKDSVRFADATPAPIAAIQVGDQLRARGEKNGAGVEVNADEVVSGTFRNISGLIASVDVAAGSFTVKDLLTKDVVTIHVMPTAQMRRLPETMAGMLAARLKESPVSSSPVAEHMRGQGGAPDLQMLLNHAPAITLQDLKKGDAVMLVSTAGQSDVTAVTLLAGIEPLLQAPAASQNLLSNWSMGSGSADTGTN